MRTSNTARSFINGCSNTVLCCIALIVCHCFGKAQSTTIYDGVAPASAAPGSPLGSYSISNFEDINLFNGVMNLKFPLASLGGRGNTGLTALYTLQHNLWTVQEQVIGTATYESALPGGTGESVSFSGFGAIGFRRNVYPKVSTCVNGSPEVNILSMFVFRAPDGTETILYDQASQGKTLLTACGTTNTKLNRGRIFTSADRSLTYITDNDIVDGDGSISQTTGTLHVNDGTVYRFINEIDHGSTQVTDKNGNIMTLAWTNIVGGNNVTGRQTVVTDSLNRTITATIYAGSVNTTSTITFKGYGGSQRTLKLHSSMMNQVLVPGETIKTEKELFPDLYYYPGTGDITFDDYVLSAIEYPNGQSMQFLYNSYGEVARILLPTGGGYDYHYDPNSRYGLVMQRRLQTRTTYSSLTPTTSYSDPPSSLIESKTYFSAERRLDLSPRRTIVTVQNKDSNDVLLSQETHEYYGEPNGYQEGCHTGWPVWYDGREYKSDKYTVSNGTPGGVAESVEYTFSVDIKPNSYGFCTESPTTNPQIIMTTKTLSDVGLQTKDVYAYDQYSNRTDTWEYDYGSGSAGQLLRHTKTTYMTINPYQNNLDYTDPNLYITNLPAETDVYDGAGILASKITFEYDRYDLQSLKDEPNIVQHDGKYNIGYGSRGNLVKITRYSLMSPLTTISTYSQYDIAGNVVKTIDGLNIPTIFDYTDRYGSPAGEARSNTSPPELNGGLSYAYPTHVTNNLGHQTYAKYDYYLGRAVDAEDVNGMVSSFYYNDSLDRQTQIVSAINDSTTKKQTAFTYNDASHIITTSRDLSAYGDSLLKNEIVYDGLGRTIESRSYEDNTHYILTSTQFDALGRPYKVSYPYRPSDVANWTVTAYDSLGRVISVTTPDDAVVTTSYDGNLVTVTDQSGNTRRSETDALGRLTRVIEDPATSNYDTDYSYDALGNLTKVTQGVQTRTFTYDLLSRLTSVSNPEYGTSSSTTYSYDPNGNLTQKTDPRGVITTMTYDELNRVTSKTYSGNSPEATTIADATPAVNYFYDKYSTLPSGAPTITGGAPIGRLIGVTYGGGIQGAYYKHDAEGKISTSYQRQDALTFQTAYKYNLAGNVTTETRSDKRKTFFYFDQAARLMGFQTETYPYLALNDIVTGIEYTPFGGIQQETYGNGLLHTLDYNVRQQPMRIWLGQPGNPGSISRIDYIFGLVDDVNKDDTDIHTYYNNGNIGRIKYYQNGILQYSQTFQYDGVNRLRYAVEHNNGNYIDSARAWYQTFAYDRFGNRGIDVANTSDNVDASNGALQLTEFDASNNRIKRSGFAYDAAGNLLAEPGKSYTYDAENRIVSSTVQGGVTSQYVYDGNGRRVKKIVDGIVTNFEYGAGGDLLTERDSSAAPIKDYLYRNGELIATSEDGTTYKYATSDHLGSPRIWTDPNGNVVAGGRHDYLPFGEELFAGYGVRTTGQGYATSTQQDGQRKQFTGYERDDETGLDFAQARYLSNMQGRFTSPDPLLSSGTIYDPQSWNRYSLALNNPLKYTDPSGLFVWDISLGGSLSDDQLREIANRFDGSDREAYLNVIAKRQAFRDARTQAEHARDALPAGAERDTVSESLASYGTEGVSNGVSVGQGLLADGVAAEARTAYFPFDTNTNTFSAQVEVVLSTRSGGNLPIDIAHEGRHVGDAQAFAGALTADLVNQGANAIAGPLNRTQYEREVRAYLVSSYTAQGLGLPNLTVGRREIWNSGWREAVRADLRSRAINAHLSESPVYHLTPQAPGDRYIPR